MLDSKYDECQIKLLLVYLSGHNQEEKRNKPALIFSLVYSATVQYPPLSSPLHIYGLDLT